MYFRLRLTALVKGRCYIVKTGNCIPWPFCSIPCFIDDCYSNKMELRMEMVMRIPFSASWCKLCSLMVPIDLHAWQRQGEEGFCTYLEGIAMFTVSLYEEMSSQFPFCQPITLRLEDVLSVTWLDSRMVGCARKDLEEWITKPALFPLSDQSGTNGIEFVKI